MLGPEYWEIIIEVANPTKVKCNSIYSVAGAVRGGEDDDEYHKLIFFGSEWHLSNFSLFEKYLGNLLRLIVDAERINCGISE